MQLRRSQACAGQWKLPGQPASSLHASATHRALATSQRAPSPHTASSVQPGTHAFSPWQLHAIGSQTSVAPRGLQSLSVVHSPGALLHAPQPFVVPGAPQIPLVHASSDEQHTPLGQPSAGHCAGVSLAARQPRYATAQPQPGHSSATQPMVTRQSPRDSPWQAEAGTS